MEQTEETNDPALALIWGAEQIAKEIGVNRRRAFYMLESGAIPARKVGGRWVAERGKLRAFFVGECA